MTTMLTYESLKATIWQLQKEGRTMLPQEAQHEYEREY
jgi:hypothetical protein